MKAILDVHYTDDCAHAACVIFASWTDSTAAKVLRASVPGVRPYRPGHFFERELPALLAVLERSGESFSHILVDGYVHLKSGPGLGAHLHNALPYSAAVIGVAKNPLQLAERFKPILRGRSSQPLFVSAIGWDMNAASGAIADMHGRYRIPTLLRLADHLAKSAKPGIDDSDERLP